MTREHIQKLWAIILIICLLALSPAAVSAQGGTVQRLEINYADASAWPQVSIFATAADKDGAILPPAGLTVQVFEDARPVSAGVTATSERTGLAVVILVDLSGSMTDPGMVGPTRLADAQRTALEFVNSKLQDGDLVGVVGFATIIRPENRMELTADRGQAAALISRLTPEADPKLYDTALWDASWAAFRMFNEHPDATLRDRIKRMRRAVVVFSDGNNTVGGGPRPGDLAIRARELNISYHTVALKSPPGAGLNFEPPKDEDVQWLATTTSTTTSGSFFDYGDTARRGDLPAFFDRLAGQRNQLRISYPSRALNGQHATRIVVATGAASQEAERTWFGGGCKLSARIVEPAAGASYGCSPQTAKVPVRVETGCADGAPRQVDQVEFYDNGVLFGTATAKPFVQEWDPGKTKTGNHTFSAVVRDATLGELLTTDPRAVQVAPPARPELRLISPAAGTTVTRGRTSLVTLEADVSFPDGCQRDVTVRFKRDGSPLPNAEFIAPPYRYQWDVSELPEGTYQISVEASDNTTDRPVSAGPYAVTIEISLIGKLLAWLRANWYVPALALGLLLLLILLLRTRSQVGRAVSQAAVRVRNTIVGRPLANARATLQVVRGPAQGRTYTLTERINTIGRDPQGCEVAIGDDGYLSGRHFRIEFTDQGGISLYDVGSRHGTTVNGQAIQPNQPVVLRGGERIRAGESEFEFRLPSRRVTQVVQRDRSGGFEP